MNRDLEKVKEIFDRKSGPGRRGATEGGQALGGFWEPGGSHGLAQRGPGGEG